MAGTSSAMTSEKWFDTIACSSQPPGGVLHDAKFSKLVDVEACLDETEIAGEIDVALQRGEVRQHVRIAIVIFVGEDPGEPLGRLLGDAGTDLHCLLVVRGIEIPAHNANRVLHEIR